jgi:hypothetical protein
VHALEKGPDTASDGDPGQSREFCMMTSSTSDDDDKVVRFPTTPEERRALHRARQEAERQRLINLFLDEAAGDQALFRTPAGECYADLIIEGVRQTWQVRSKQFRFEYIRYLRREIERQTSSCAVGSAIKKAAINAAIDEFELKAICSQVEREVHVRVASDGGDLYINLGDPGWHAVRITDGGWSVVQSPPVRFRRSPDMRALPFPERGTPITALREFLPNLGGEGDFTLIVAFLLAALRSAGSYPLLAVTGEQGTAKTTLLRVLRALIDPSRVMTTPLPLSGRDLFIACRNSYVQAYENVSKLDDKMSDHLCRVATGGGMRTRTLRTDVDETTFAGARPIMMEGIGSFISRPDLLDRSIVLSLASLPNRKTEGAVWAEFDRRKAGIFGALCDMLVSGVRQFPEIHLVHPPRMADFATFAVACGLDTFEAEYSRNRQNATDIILEQDVLAQSLEALLAEKGGWWKGTAMELLSEIGPAARITLPKVLSERLSRLAPALRSHGISVSHEARTANRREIRIARIDDA